MKNGRISAVALIAGFGLALAAAIGLASVMRLRETPPAGPAATPGPASPALPPGAAEKPDAAGSPTPDDPAPVRPNPPKPKPSRGEVGSGDGGHSNVVPTPESLEKIIHGKGSSKEKAVALKLAFRNRIDPDLKAFSEVLTEAGVEADLRVTAIRILADGSAADPKARGLLETFASTHPSTDPGRDLALAAVLKSGTDSELSRCSNIVFGEHNAESVASAARALAGNRSDAARSLLLSISTSHPDPDARHRAEEERTGNYCPDHVPSPESKDD